MSGILRFREMRSGEESAVLALVMRVFAEFVAPEFSQEGVAEFTRAARSSILDRPRGRDILVTESHGELLGMIDLRDGFHVSLLFVDAAHQRQGIGRRLLASALSRHPSTRVVTVNSGPSTVRAYAALGFVATGPEAEVNGIRFVPMQKKLLRAGQRVRGERP